MKIRPYLTYQGTCSEAIDLYKRAFKTGAIDHSATFPYIITYFLSWKKDRYLG